MNKQRYLILAVLLFSLVGSTVQAKAPTEYEYTLTYKFENRGNTSFTLTEEDISIPIFINTTGTAVKLYDISRDYSTKVMDQDGNKGVLVDIDLTLSPGEVETFSATYRIMSMEQEIPDYDVSDAEGFDAIPVSLVDEYCFSTETFPMDDPLFGDLASELVSGEDTVLEAVGELVEYIVDETTYCNYETPQYPNSTLANQLGDCDDQSILLITMCRSLNIPAYLQVGVYFHSGINDQDTSWDDHLINEADGVAWHGWAMIYIPPWGWVPVDLTMTNADTGIGLIQSAPEYGSNIVPVLNVSKQPYIGGTLETRERFTNSSVYVTVSDKADVIYSADDPLQNYLLLGLGAALIITIGLMYRFGDRN